MILVDGHLDIAFNRLCFGRDPRESARDVRAREDAGAPQKWRGQCMVGLPELRAGRVAVICATLFAPRARDWKDSGLDGDLGYETGEEAEAVALRQLDVYREVSGEGEGYRRIETARDLTDVLAGWEDGATGDVGIVPLMEGADPIVRPADAGEWFRRGVRLVGLSWRGTRYAGGTGEPAPLTDLGRELVPELDAAGIVLDLSHAADESARGALELFHGPVIASHSNPRALCDTDRQMPDDLIRAVGRRGGVIGTVPFNKMLVAGWAEAGQDVPLMRVAECIHHVADVTGTHHACAIGSDFDGGFGAEASPVGLDTIADLPRIADPLSDLDFSDEQIRDILGGNWIRFLGRALPGES